jgi:ApaG protein
MSVATTRGVRVEVKSQWLPERSNPTRKQWFFTYHVTISNHGEEVVQLVSRHWIIKNGAGKTEHVRGPGVVGETPTLAPGESFKYQSFCPLDTPIGSMEGTYQMIVVGREQEKFDALIAPFTLAVPTELN